MLRSSLAIIVLALALVGCASTKPASTIACPYLRQYDQATLARVLEEYRSLPAGSPLRVMIGDYAVLRDQVRACRGAK
jgi:hypothetical protein